MKSPTCFAIFVLVVCCGRLDEKKAQGGTGRIDSKIRSRIDEMIIVKDSGVLTVLDSLTPYMKDAAKSEQAYWWNKRAQSHLNKKRYDSARIYAHNALVLADKAKSLTDQISANTTLSGIFVFMGNMDSASFYGHKGYYLAKKIDSVPLGICWRLSQIYTNLGDKINTGKYAFEGYRHSRSNKFYSVVFSAALAAYYDDKNMADSAIFYWSDVLKDTTFRSKEFEAFKYANFGMLLATTPDKADTGLIYLLNALPIHRELNLIDDNKLLNVAYGFYRNGLYKQSLAYLDTSLSLNTKVASSPPIRRLIWKLRADNYKEMGNYKMASWAFDSAYKKFDEQLASTLAEKARELEVKYKVKEKEDKITSLSTAQALSKQISRQQNMIIVILIATMAFMTLSGVLLWRRRQQKMLSREAELRQQLLRSQMESHFLFNSLGVLQSLIRESDMEKSIEYLGKFSRLLRLNLENARRPRVSLTEELDALQNYLSIQAMNFEDQFSYNISVYQDYQNDNVFIPPMLLQPFVENAIFHGVLKLKETGYITITIDKSEYFVHCVIKDNGVGLRQSTKKDNSYATIITQERLSILSRHTQKPARLQVSNLEDLGGTERGCMVILDIPYK